jgi:hypothetical protein
MMHLWKIHYGFIEMVFIGLVALGVYIKRGT